MISVEKESSTPPYEQVRAQLAAQINDGHLTAGTRLPAVRQLADDLGLAVNTVARAYRELESAGLVETRGRGGTVVAPIDAARRRVRDAAASYVSVAREAGLDPEAIVDAVRTAINPTAAFG